MTVRDLYGILSERIPASLSEPWDNDGEMCVPEEDREVRRVLIALDVTEEIADLAVEGGYDLIISHHPLLFRPLTHFTEDEPKARILMKLSAAGVSVFSFHTRADRVSGGVNDCLAGLLGLYGVTAFGEGGLGRIGTVEGDPGAQDFAAEVKETLGAPAVLVSDGYVPVHTVAVVGGDGKDFLADAIAAGADTFLSGRIGYNVMEEAAERGINLIEAGHYYTEAPVCAFFRDLCLGADPSLTVDIENSGVIRLI